MCTLSKLGHNPFLALCLFDKTLCLQIVVDGLADITRWQCLHRVLIVQSSKLHERILGYHLGAGGSSQTRWLHRFSCGETA